MYPRLWSRYFKRVVGVEPDPLNFTAFDMNCVGEQYTKVCAALGDEEGTARLNLYGRENVGMHSMSRPNQSAESFDVRVITVDSLALPALDLMQLDVEGYEMRVLLGADSTIRKYQPVISVESLTPDIQTLFEAHGYKKVGGSAADTVFAPR